MFEISFALGKSVGSCKKLFFLKWLTVENGPQENRETGDSKTKSPHESNAWKCEYTRWKEYPAIKRINGTTGNELKIWIKSNKMIQ